MIVPPDQYYISRKSIPLVDYWGERSDPDGIIRDRMGDPNEERQYIEDIADELAFIESLRPSSVLDVGCGPGWFLSAVDSPQRFGVEVCPVAAAEAHLRGFRVQPSTKDYEPGVQVVRCHHVIEHMERPVDELKAMHDVCREWLLISTPDFGSPAAVRFGAEYRMLHDSTHCSLFTLESMTRLLRHVGFTIENITFPFPLRYATADTMQRWHDISRVSPPWPGNWMTFYCRKDAA